MAETLQTLSIISFAVAAACFVLAISYGSSLRSRLLSVIYQVEQQENLSHKCVRQMKKAA